MSSRSDAGQAYAEGLAGLVREDFGLRAFEVRSEPLRSATEDWAASGAMALTGRADGPPLPSVGAPASVARGAMALVRALAPLPAPALGDIDARVLSERAALAGLRRRGPWSAGGAFRLYPARDGWMGLNLPRPQDVDLLPALTEGAVGPDGHGPDISAWLGFQTMRTAAERGRLLGLPIVALPRGSNVLDAQTRYRWDGEIAGPWQVRAGPRRASGGRPLVVLLASLWAGPLAAQLLEFSGCRVICVESSRRPDGARSGPAGFHDLLHHGQQMIALDIPDSGAVGVLRRLLSRADLVVDGSRPRVMRHLGIDVNEVVDGGTIWISITGYGRTGPWSEQPAFGDDAAVAGGLVAWDDAGPVPAGDAIADPLTGLHAAVAGLAALRSGRAWLIDIALRDIAAVAAAAAVDGSPHGARLDVTPAPPRARTLMGRARPIGADTDAVLEELGIPCD